MSRDLIKASLCPALTGNSSFMGNNCNPQSPSQIHMMCNAQHITFHFIQMPYKLDLWSIVFGLLPQMAWMFFSDVSVVTRIFLLKLSCDTINHFNCQTKQAKGKNCSRSANAYTTCYCFTCFSLQYFVSSRFSLGPYLIDLFTSAILSLNVK